MTNPLVIRVPGTTTDTAKPILRKDAMLKTDVNGGVKFLFDLGNLPGYPGGNPVNGTVIPDLSDHADGVAEVSAGQAVAYLGGGFDYEGVTAINNDIKAPSSCLASIYAASNQYFMKVAYRKLPLLADWPSTTSLMSILADNTATSGYTTVPDLLTIGLGNAPNISARRQTSVGAADTLTMNADANMYGQVCQIAFYRTAAGQTLRVKSALGTKTATAAVGSNNSANFSACEPRWGFIGQSGALTPANSTKQRSYRGWIEDLALSGRDPVTVLDKDFTDTVTRALYS